MISRRTNPKPKAIHAADAHDNSQIPQAIGFMTSFFLGRGAYDKQESGTLEHAREVAGKMNANPDYVEMGRKALVYAILPNGVSVLVPDSYQAPTAEDIATRIQLTAPAQVPGARTPTIKDAVEAAIDAGQTPTEFRKACEVVAAQLSKGTATMVDDGLPPSCARTDTPASKAARTRLRNQVAERKVKNPGNGTSKAAKLLGAPSPKALAEANAKAAKTAKARKVADTLAAPIADQVMAKAHEAAGTVDPTRVMAAFVGVKNLSKRHLEVFAAAEAGTLPTPPELNGDSNEPYRRKLAPIVAMVTAGDLAALTALALPTYDSSYLAIARYRNLAVVALEARRKGKKVTVGIRKTSPAYDVWRLTFDGSVLGDSRGYSNTQAQKEACNLVSREPDRYVLDLDAQ